ncbi:zinc-binding dehydrogenase [Pelagicoccus sp. SDUM812002]|uniref:zinc-dependent alcohol dehydrogenase n=1 Tax=Pelagicoccus sp. SDUM812002 TaxID=3041266 RepID=UPI00280F9DB4|nr:zinc-binding dehydrogenase [Pelagicoccus sp. SDUM812002]MDQ8188414.1 zinc-binding dehydrogenase [Pelagicoccus sp. SDUM812002]
MKAIQYQAAGQPEVVEVPRPTPGKGQVLLKVECVATCPQWDMHLMRGESMAPGGVIDYPTPVGHPGHEAVGYVESLGEGVEEFDVGDRVALWQDQGANRDGCYAEYVIADTGNLLRVPVNLDTEAIASLELAMCIQVSFDQILNIGPIEGKRFGVSGLGPAGLLAVQLAKAYGASEVVAFDPVESRRELALSLGADRVLDPTDPDCFPYDRFKPERLALAVDCTGLGVSVAFLLKRTRDVVALFGVLREEVGFGFFQWCGGLHLIGYGNQNRFAAERALEHIKNGALKLSPLVSKTLPLAEYSKGVELLERKEAIKICFTP